MMFSADPFSAYKPPRLFENQSPQGFSMTAPAQQQQPYHDPFWGGVSGAATGAGASAGLGSMGVGNALAGATAGSALPLTGAMSIGAPFLLPLVAGGAYLGAKGK